MCNEQRDTIKRADFLDQLRNCQLLRKDTDGKLHCTLNTVAVIRLYKDLFRTPLSKIKVSGKR